MSVVPVVHRVCLVLRVSVSRPRGVAHPKWNREPPELRPPGVLYPMDTLIVLPTDRIAQIIDCFKYSYEDYNLPVASCTYCTSCGSCASCFWFSAAQSCSLIRDCNSNSEGA